MKYISLLGEPIKGVFLIDLFETYDVDVTYEYDRVFENTEDEYHAAIPDMGLEFIFDASQRLMTLFMKKVEHSGHNPFSGEDPREVSFSSGGEAMSYAESMAIDALHQEAKSDPMFGEISEWVKFNFESYSVHYQFGADGLHMATLQLEEVQQVAASDC